jgi:hypothetical protein
MRKAQIVSCAKWIIQLGSGKKETLGTHWFARWAKRHPEIHETITKTLANDRKQGLKDFDIKEWFELLKQCKEEFDIDDGDIWNFDETGFQVGIIKGTTVMVPREIKIIESLLPA